MRQNNSRAEIVSVNAEPKGRYFGDVWLSYAEFFLEKGPLPNANKLEFGGAFEICSSDGTLPDFQPKTIEVIFDEEVISYTDQFDFKQEEKRWYYSIDVGLLGCGELVEFEAVLVGEMAGGVQKTRHKLSVGQIVCRREFTSIASDNRIKPLLMSGLGRTGTTRMMQLLLQHEKIIGAPTHPYENQPAQYWLHALRVLSSPADRNEEAPRVGFQQITHRVIRNPCHRNHKAMELPQKDQVMLWLENSHALQLATFFMGQIEQYYKTLGHDVGKYQAAYFIEKTQPNTHSQVFHELYDDAKEIFIIRHPLDVLCSVRSFFPENAFYRTDDYVEALKIGYERMLRRIEASLSRCFVADYNQLVSDAPSLMNAVFKFLGLQDDGQQKNIELEEHKLHATSGSSQQSIFRWKKDLTEQESDILKLLFAPTMLRIKKVMPSFNAGYEVFDPQLMWEKKILRTITVAPKIELELRHEPTGWVINPAIDDAGLYSVTDLPQGEYSFKFSNGAVGRMVHGGGGWHASYDILLNL